MLKFEQNFKYIAITIGIVLTWRGVWGLADLYLFPDELVISFIASFILGIVVLLLVDFKKLDLRELFPGGK